MSPSRAMARRRCTFSTACGNMPATSSPGSMKGHMFMSAAMPPTLLPACMKRSSILWRRRRGPAARPPRTMSSRSNPPAAASGMFIDMTKPTHRIDRSRALSQPLGRLDPDERMKDASNYLRGSIAEGLLDRITGAVPSPDDVKLMKFHGIYQQDDRDLRDERRRQKLEPAYQFMIRVRLPGGVCSPAQWLKLDELARAHGGQTLRLTTRQTFQFHWVLKDSLRPVIQGLHEALLDTVAACGD